MDKTIWYFINTENQNQKIFVVGIESAKITSSLMGNEQRRSWVVRNVERKILTRVCDCNELIIQKREDTLTEELPPIRELKSTNTVTNPASGTSNTVLKSVIPNQVHYAEAPHSKYFRRKNKRVNGKLRVIVFIDEKVFRTYTKNISIGGLYLEKPLPNDLVGQKCRIIVRSESNQLNIEFEAIMKSYHVDGTRVIFSQNQPQESLKHLSQWIETMDVPAMNDKIISLSRAA